MVLDSFSRWYWVETELRVEPWSWTEDYAVVDEAAFYDLVVESGLDPVIGYCGGSGGSEFEILPSNDVPTGICAVPGSPRFSARSGGILMISKQNKGLDGRGR